jgi:hypothetical protein
MNFGGCLVGIIACLKRVCTLGFLCFSVMQ